MMKQKYFFIFLLMILISGNLGAQSQCGTGVLSNISTNNVDSCGRNGSITVGYTLTNATQAILALYKLPGNTLLLTKALNTTTGTETLNNLDAGNYQVRLLCAANQGQTYTTSNATIGGSYVPISATINATNVCTNFTSGGTITANISGGSLGYKVLVKKTNDANFADDPNNYQTISGNTFSKTVTEFGTYQIRVKDACNNYKTFQYEISSNQSKVEYLWNPHAICNQPDKLKGTFWYASNPDDQGVMNFPAGGLKIEIRHDNANGTLAYSGTLQNADSTFEYTKSPTEEYYVTTTNICGLTHSYYVRKRNDDYKPERPTISPSVVTTGCGTNERMIISNNFHNQTYWKYPVTITITPVNGGSAVYTHTSAGDQPIRWFSNPISMGDYFVKVTDRCNNTITKRVNNPKNGTQFSLDMDKTQFVKWRCNNNDPANPNLEPLSQTGTTQVLLAGKGYLSDRANAVVTIKAGPSNVGTAAVYIDGEFWGWNNMAPGNYTVEFLSCGTRKNLTFTVPNNVDVLLQQSITSRVIPFCTGGGAIQSNIVYNGSANYSVQLLNAQGAVLQENSSGNFTGLSAGTYKTRLKLLPWCKQKNTYNTYYSQDQPYYVEYSKSLVVPSSAPQPSVINKQGIVCEGQSGQLQKGCVYLELQGVSPFRITYTNTAGSTVTLNNQSYSVTICDLDANRNYLLNITDNCGNNITEQVTLRTMESVNAENTKHPCYGQSYTLSVPYFAGATYRWTNSSGAVVSNSREYAISNYHSSYDGSYTATITWNNCVVRTVTITIDGNRCNQTIDKHCFKPAGTGSPALETKHGITSLARAGADNGNWPMVRKGAYTVLESKTKGFVLNRLTTQQKNALTPLKGMMVYDTDLNCLSIFNGQHWKCFDKPACPN